MDPLATVKIADGLAAMLEEAGVGDLGEIIGAALPV
jgi:hypothetical protein